MTDSRDGNDGMKSLAKCPNIQYALIRATSTHDAPERLVLSYANEKSLRSLIAKPSIIALGFASRSAAYEAGGFHDRVASQHMHVMAAKRNSKQRLSLVFHFGKDRLTHALTNLKGQADLYRAVQSIFATAILLLYSKNIVSATIRTALGV